MYAYIYCAGHRAHTLTQKTIPKIYSQCMKREIDRDKEKEASTIYVRSKSARGDFVWFVLRELHAFYAFAITHKLECSKYVRVSAYTKVESYYW